MINSFCAAIQYLSENTFIIVLVRITANFSKYILDFDCLVDILDNHSFLIYFPSLEFYLCLSLIN